MDDVCGVEGQECVMRADKDGFAGPVATGGFEMAARSEVILVRFGVEISKIHATPSRLLESTKIQGSIQNFPQKIFFLGFCVKLSSEKTV